MTHKIIILSFCPSGKAFIFQEMKAPRWNDVPERRSALPSNVSLNRLECYVQYRGSRKDVSESYALIKSEDILLNSGWCQLEGANNTLHHCRGIYGRVLPKFIGLKSLSKFSEGFIVQKCTRTKRMWGCGSQPFSLRACCVDSTPLSPPYSAGLFKLMLWLPLGTHVILKTLYSSHQSSLLARPPISKPVGHLQTNRLENAKAFLET